MRPISLLISLVFLLFFPACTVRQDASSADSSESQPAGVQSPKTIVMNISSSAFGHNESIPSQYTCDGADINPPLSISGVPDGVKSLALIMDDPDAPVGTWDHWIVWNIPPGLGSIVEDSVPGIQGKNGWGRSDYGGPCPPRGTHRYFFKLYALDRLIDLGSGASKAALEKAMQGHILAQAELIGLYQRK